MAKRRTIALNPTFRLAVVVNGLLCVSTLVVMLVVSFVPASNEEVADTASVCERVFLMTAGAFIGLLGGRAAAPDPPTA